MPWKDLSETEQNFIMTFFTKGKSWRKAAHKRSANVAVINEYDNFMKQAAIAEKALKRLEGTPSHRVFQDNIENIVKYTRENGDFVRGAVRLFGLPNQILTEAGRLKREEEEASEKARYYAAKELEVRNQRKLDDPRVQVLSKMLVEAEPGGEDVDPVDPSKLPAIKRFTSVYQRANLDLLNLFQGDLSGEPYTTAMDKVVTDFTSARDEVMLEIEELIATPASLTTAGGVLEDNRGFQTLKTECRGIANDLVNWGCPNGAKLEKELDDACKDAETTSLYNVGITALTLWKQGAERESASYLSDFREKLQVHKDKLAQVKTRKEQIGSEIPSEQIEELNDLISIAEQTIATAEAPGKGKNASAIRPLQQILVSASVLANELKNASITNVSTRENITKIEEILGEASGGSMPEGQTVMPKTFEALRTEFTDLHTDWLKKSPQKMHMDFIAFLGRAEAFKVQVEEMKAWRDRMNRTVVEVKKRIHDLSKIVFDFGKEEHGWFATKMREVFGRTGIEFEGQASIDVADIETAIMSEDPTTHKYTEDKLMALGGKLANWLGSAQKLANAKQAGEAPSPTDMNIVASVLDDQAKAVEARKAKEKQIADFKDKSRKVDDFIDQLAGAPKVAEETIQEYKSIKDLNKAARNQADNNLEAAEEMFARVRFRVNSAMGAEPEAENNFEWLAKIPDRWGKAVDALLGDIDRLSNKVKAAAEKDPEDIDLEQLDDDLTVFGAVARKFAKDAFNTPAGILGDPDTAGDKDARKRQRENALQQVRLYRGYLQGNPTLRHAIMNPFEVAGIGMAANQVLNKIELEVLRGI